MSRQWVLWTVGTLVLTGLGGCMSSKPARTTSTIVGTGQAVQAARPPSPARERPAWQRQIDRLQDVPRIWALMNRHQDDLGRVVAALESEVPRPRAIVVRPRPRVTTPTPRPRAGATLVDPRGARPGPRRLSRVFATPGVARPTPRCRRACGHIKAICYAARRICQIAERLAEDTALRVCERARDRCRTSLRQAAARCPPCAGAGAYISWLSVPWPRVCRVTARYTARRGGG